MHVDTDCEQPLTLCTLCNLPVSAQIFIAQDVARRKHLSPPSSTSSSHCYLFSIISEHLALLEPANRADTHLEKSCYSSPSVPHDQFLMIRDMLQIKLGSQLNKYVKRCQLKTNAICKADALLHYHPISLTLLRLGVQKPFLQLTEIWPADRKTTLIEHQIQLTTEMDIIRGSQPHCWRQGTQRQT